MITAGNKILSNEEVTGGNCRYNLAFIVFAGNQLNSLSYVSLIQILLLE